MEDHNIETDKFAQVSQKGKEPFLTKDKIDQKNRTPCSKPAAEMKVAKITEVIS